MRGGNKRFWLCLSVAVFAGGAPVMAQDADPTYEPAPYPSGTSVSNSMSGTNRSASPWTGFYSGVSGSFGFGSTTSSSKFIYNGRYSQASYLPGTESASRDGLLGGADLGYLAQFGRFVFGTGLDFSAGSVRSSASAAGITDTKTPRTFLGYQNFKLDRLATVRELAGFLVTRDLMAYGFGGLAAGHVDNDSHLNFTNELNSQGMETYGAHYNGGRSQSMAGWTAGVGAEYKLSSGVGIKLEYSHYDLGTATANAYRPNLSYYHLQSNFPTGGNLVRLAFDYHFGGSRDYSDYQIYDEYSGTMVPAPAYFSPLRYEFGTRYWYSNGTFRYDLHGSGNNVINGVNSNSALVSRLSYTGEHSNSGEIYGSAKYPGGFQVNAMLGGGAASGGTLRDEDFPPFIDPYSRTESTQKTGALTYSIVDVGYSVFSRYGFSIVPFLGYAYDREQLNAYGCTQVASNQDVCGNAGGPPVYSGALTISENGTWSAMRAGIGANYALPWHDLRFGVNGAWLPFGSLAGNDDHWLRIDTPNASTFSGPIVQTGTAHGMQLEATAKIALTDKVDLGVGGRYWYFFTHGTSEFFSPFYEPGKQSTTFTTRRYGEFVELSTHF